MAKTPKKPKGCKHCHKNGARMSDFQLRMAFQPIVEVRNNRVFAYEALVRGPNGEGAGSVISKVTEETRYAFDQACRVCAVETAASIDPTQRISINFMPNAVYNPANCIQTTIWAADKCGFPLENIIFEFTEGESISDSDHLLAVIVEYQNRGFATAIDDFGSGFSGLTRLAELQPDYVKIDIDLIRDIDGNSRKQVIVGGIVDICSNLGIDVIAEGIEHEGEARVLLDLGINFMQGFYFAKPGLEEFPVFREMGGSDDLIKAG